VELTAEDRLLDGEFENFVDGEYGTISSSTYTVESPFDEDYTVTVYDSGLGDTPRAISTARDAQEAVDGLSLDERRAIVEDAAEDYAFSDDEIEYFVKMLGMPRDAVEFKLDRGREALDQLPDIVDNKYGEFQGEIAEKRGPGMYEVHKSRDEPMSGFLPANDPSVAPNVLAYAVLTGNTMVIRPSSEELYSTLKSAEALTANGYPDGALNVLLYDSSNDDNQSHRGTLLNETGTTILFGGDETVQSFRDVVDDPQKDLVGFGEGRANAYVFADANLDKTVDSVVEGMVQWPNGCNAMKAVRVHPAVYDEFAEKLVTELDALEMGDLMDTETDIGYIDPETVSFLENRASGRTTASADELIYPEVDEIGLNGDRLDAAVAADGGAATHMKPIVIEAASERSEFMQEEYPGYVLGIAPVAPEDLAERYEAAYTDNGNVPITVSVYTENFDADKQELVQDLPAHLIRQNESTIRINPWVRHQGRDWIDEMTRTESWEIEPGFWEKVTAAIGQSL